MALVSKKRQTVGLFLFKALCGSTRPVKNPLFASITLAGPKQALALKHSKFPRHSVPVSSILRRCFTLSDRIPTLGQFRIQCDKSLLVFRHLVIPVYGLSWALRYAKGTIYAPIRVDYKKVWPFTKAIGWANVHAIGEFAFDTVISHYIGHKIAPSSLCTLLAATITSALDVGTTLISYRCACLPIHECTTFELHAPLRIPLGLGSTHAFASLTS